MKHEAVQEYYGKTLQSTGDLKTNACCTPSDMPDWLKAIQAKIHDDVLSRYYGCGLIAPDCLTGARILDLGCGSGRDVYTLSALVGETGQVVGVDMTDEQLNVARQHQDFHAKAFGHSRVNTEFHKGYIETLGDLGLEPASFDVIISNCVINLATDKEAVLRGVYELLKPGGEMYFSDVYASRRIPAELAEDEVLYGECLSGALYWNDFLTFAKRAGFTDPRLVEHRPLTIENAAVEARVGNIKFTSALYRLWKLDLESDCEDYGQAVIYKGSVPGSETALTLDSHHVIEAGKVFAVCGNTWKMLSETRLAEHFDFIGDFKTHYGIFEGCGTSSPFTETTAPAGEPNSSGCC